MRARILLTILTAALCAAVVVVVAGAQGPRDGRLLAPDLVQAPPTRVSVRMEDGRARLGFASAVSNAGSGPLTIRGARASRATALMAGTQLVRREGAAPLRRGRAGTLRYTRAPTHEHWHLLGFDRYLLRRAGGARTIVADRKTGFCLGDRYDARPDGALPGEPGAPAYQHNCGLRRPGLLRLTEGISVGFGDDYDAYREGQFLDVTGLPAGDYELVHRVNGDRRLLEERYDNNTSCLGVTLGPPREARAPSLRLGRCR